MKSSLGRRLHGFLTLIFFFFKKGVLCVHACMGGIYVHICSCVYPYIQMHGDSNINVVYFPQSLFTLIFSGRTIQKLKLELTWHTNERILSEINLGGLPHPLLVVQFWAEILNHQDDAEDKYPSLSASLCEQFPQSSCHHSLPPPIVDCIWIIEPKYIFSCFLNYFRQDVFILQQENN